MSFTSFVLDQLPPGPCRVLEIGCGDRGGVVPALVDAGYDAIGVDPRAPDGDRFIRGDYRDVEGTFDAVVAGRVLHHVDPLGEGLDRTAALAPLIVVDEFAWDLIGPEAQEWYDAQHRLLTAAGMPPPGPPTIEQWRWAHPGLHPHDTLLAGLRERYDEVALEWVPYLHRWLGGPSSEALESALVAAGAFAPIGYRWSGTTRSSRSSP